MSNNRVRPTAPLLGIAGLMLVGMFPSDAVAGEVKVFPVKDIDYTAYKTFKIRAPKVLTKMGLREDEPTVGPMITDAVRRELIAKGLTEVEDGADMEINTLGQSAAVPQVEALIYNTSFYGPSVIGTAPIMTIGRYNKEGTLFVNMIDPRSKMSIWLGMSTRAMGKPSNLKGDIDKAAKALFKKYPSLVPRK